MTQLPSRLAILALRPAPTLQNIEQWLDLAQRERFQSISNPDRAMQFRAARHLAIELLQHHAIEPHLIIQPSGRPQALHWIFPDGLSWSHTQHWAAAALGAGRVGVDIETARARRNIIAIAEQYFTAKELKLIRSLPAAEQLQMFYILWVAKEALLKALGTGIVGGLDRFELLCLDGVWQLKSADLQQWQVQVWQLGEATFCAVASDRAQLWTINAEQAQLILQCGNKIEREC